MHIPRATYRLQFNEKFQLSDALALVPYLHDLGISHVYASPLFAACPHSLHGYDVCDFNRLNPEIGTEADLEKLVAALHEKQMGLVLDIVPNHMGIGTPENFWWWDVLMHGQASRFADNFDIDWHPAEKELRGKILIPVLAENYEAILNRGELRLVPEKEKFLIAYHEHRFPLAPETIMALPTNEKALKDFNADFATVDRLIQRQHYRLEFYGVGDAKLNYRRFFAVSSLAAVRVEDERVFAEVHALLRRWYERGWIDGLRVDHPDGLRDPEKYLQWLRRLAPKAWIVVEKILEQDELLPSQWPVAGTTGYDFLNQLNGVFVDPAAEMVFSGFNMEFTRDRSLYASEMREKKRLVLKTLFIAEINRLTGLLGKIARRNPVAKRFSISDLHEALAEVVACFPVYRSYISESTAASPADIANIKMAVQLAGETRRHLSPSIFIFIQKLLLNPRRQKMALSFITRFQQLTGPVMAKGAEDTVFYCFNRFISMNEVGGDPGQFGIPLEKFHEFIQASEQRPDSQLTTSTHDTKRSEDVRARLNVLSEMPDEWMRTVRRWSGMNACHRREDWPDTNIEYLFYQTLVGAWPLPAERVLAFIEKAARESKQHTTWSRPEKGYEDALKNFVSESLSDPEFKTDVERFILKISHAAAINSLSQTLVKLTAPGVPDIYQGCELLDFSLVDPDNRRQVDFKARRDLLKRAESLSVGKIWSEYDSGLPKLWLIKNTLALRRQLSGFSRFDYQPLCALGSKAEHILAFVRGGKVLTIVPRLFYKLGNDWADTTLELPAGVWCDEFTSEIFDGVLRLENFFDRFPVALLVHKGD